MTKLKVGDEATVYHLGTNAHYSATINKVLTDEDLIAEYNQEPTEWTTTATTAAAGSANLGPPLALSQEQYDAVYLALSTLPQDLRDKVAEQLLRAHKEMSLDNTLTPDQKIERLKVFDLWATCNQVSLDFRDLNRTQS